MTALLSVQDLSFIDIQKKGIFANPRRFVLSPINFSINAGETLAIVGENGSGKSLLANYWWALKNP